MSPFLVLRWLSLLVDAATKSVVLLAAAGVLHLLLRRASAASRHRVWLLALGSVLALPLLSAMLPQWRVRAWPSLRPPTTSLALAPPAHPLRWVIILPSRHERVGIRSGAGGSGSLGQNLRPARPDRPARLPLPAGLTLLWLAGAGVVLGQVVAAMAGVRRLERRCRRVTAGPLAVLAADVGQRLGLRRAVALRLAPAETGPVVPMTWGWRNPVVLLPAACGNWTESHLRSVLLHELAHVRRRDWPAQLLTCVTCAFYWFQPLVWLAARQIRIESERACDECVLSAGVRPVDYASHLLEVARSLRLSERARWAALTMAPRSALELRVRAILERQRDRRPAPRWAPAAASLVVLGGVIPLAAVRSGDRPAPGRRPGTVVLISVAPRPSAATPARGPRRAPLVAILERRERLPRPVRPRPRRPPESPQILIQQHLSSPRAKRPPRPDRPAALRRRWRPLPLNRLLAAVPRAAAGSAAAALPASPQRAEPAPDLAAATAADGAVPAKPDEAAQPDAIDPPAIRDAGDENDTPTSTAIFAADAEEPPGEAGTRRVAALLSGPVTPPGTQELHRTPELQEREMEPDTDVLPVTGQDGDVLSAPSEAESTIDSWSTGPAAPPQRGEAEPAVERQGLEPGGTGLTIAELWVWDPTRQGWDRVLVVWQDQLPSQAAPEVDPAEEGTPASDPGSVNSPFDPGSLDEDLWIWDHWLPPTEGEPAGDQRPAAFGRPCPPCPSMAV